MREEGNVVDVGTMNREYDHTTIVECRISLCWFGKIFSACSGDLTTLRIARLFVSVICGMSVELHCA
jgi:hypothetical protein